MKKSTDAELDAYFAGLKCRRNWWIGIAVAIALYGVLHLCGLFSSYSWIGRPQLDVQVLVLDAKTRQPLSGAMVTLFNGPSHPLEMSTEMFAQIEFGPDMESAEPQQVETNETGAAVLTREFSAHGRVTKFSEVGSVWTNDVWAKVSATGYGAVTLPLGGQDGRPRDSSNKNPVFIMVLLSRNSGL